MDFLLYTKCITLLVGYLCNQDAICDDLLTDCIYDEGSVVWCASDLGIEYKPSESIYCNYKKENE